MTTTIRTPRTTEAATALLARYAELDGRRAGIEAVRQARLAQANADADADVGPIVDALDLIRAKLEPWFNDAGKQLLPKGRKSMQLGGCDIGCRSSSKLEHGFDSDDKAVEALQRTRLAKKALKVKHSLDRPALKKMLDLGGAAKKALTGLGFRLQQGDTFFVDRVEQGGVREPA